jgi:CheY-like chemotaxis protein
MPCVLIVEDETLVALDLQLQLEDHGFSCLPPASTVEAALETVASRTPDVGVLDANLNGTSSAPVAARLQQDGIPFVYVSGYGRAYLRENLPPAPLVEKPVRVAELVAVLRRLLSHPPTDRTP